MTKRKRDEKEVPKQTKQTNPSQQDDDSNGFLVHVLNVSEFVTSKVTPNASQLQSLHLLLETLEEDRVMTDCPVSQKDVSLLLLPWAVRNILSGTNLSRWTWHSLFVSLSVIVNSNDTYALHSLSSQILTQSTLFKLCPKVALFVVSSNTTNTHDDDVNDDMPTETKNDSSASKSYAAKSYVIITEKLFHPTMDVACKLLLLPILAEVTIPSPNYDTVLIATLKLIHRLMIHGKGNPKTTFQLLSGKPILSALSKTHIYFQHGKTDEREGFDQGLLLTKEILSYGLFHPTHHLQGFYSLLHKMKTAPFSKNATMTNSTEGKGSGSFRCYQEELLATVETTISSSENSGDNEENILSIIRSTALLFEVLLQQKWDDRGEHSSRKKSPSFDLVNMHFQVFARWMVKLQWAVESENKKIRSAALQSMLEMLKSLLEHNAYSASQDDSGGYFFDFLAGIYNQIVSTSTATWDENSRESIIPILDVLLRLNHRLVHDSLRELIIYSLEIAVKGNKNYAVDLLVEVFLTYEKLRQQDYVVGQLLYMLESLQETGKTSESELFFELLNDEKVRLAASQALSTCPILLVKDIFVLFEQYFTRVISEKKKQSQTTEKCIYVAGNLVEIMSQSVIVDKSTASSIADMCEHFIENVVSQMTTTLSSDQEATRTIIFDVSSCICACIISLHARCTFWLGRRIHLAIPVSLSNYLSSFRRLQLRDSLKFHGIFNGISLLACNRLTQIDTEIHEEERKEIESNGKTKDTDALMLEGKELASSIFTMGLGSKFDNSNKNRHPWLIIVKNCFSWLQFAADAHIAQFLRWVCTISTLDRKKTPDTTTSIRAEIDLLRDSRFLEHESICMRLFPESVNAVFDLIMLGLTTTDEGKLSGSLSILKRPNIDDAIASSLYYLQYNVENVTIVDHGIQDIMCKALYILREVTVPSLKSQETAYNRYELLQTMCKIEYALRATAPSIASFLSEWTKTQCILRKAISQLLHPILSETLQKNPKTYQQAMDVIQTMFTLFATICEHSSSRDISIDCSGIEHLISCVVQAMLDSGLVTGLVTSMNNMRELTKGCKDKYALIAFTRFITEGVKKYLDSDGPVSHELVPFLKILWEISQLCVKTNLLLIEPNEHRSKVEGMLLASDLMRIDYDKTKYLQLFDEMTQEKLIACQTSMAEESVLESRTYVIGTLALSCNEKPLYKRLIDVIINEKKESILLDASFVSLMKHLTAEEIDELLRILTGSHVQASHVRYLLLSLQYASEEQIYVISKYARDIFTLTMKKMNLYAQETEKQTSTVYLDLSLEVLDHLVRNRDNLIFREFDIAVILSNISAILGSNQHAVSKVATSTFSWCTTVLASMFQRYSKFLYACVPSVISLYYCLLNHAMFGHEDRKITQQFAGVCELLVAHKDIYKKHVLGLVLEFVWQLGILPLERRNHLLPAIYSLLDTMSTYELQQLNASMGTEQKILFKSVYQAYQKVHTYRGQ